VRPLNHFGLWHDKAGNAVAQPLAGGPIRLLGALPSRISMP
jgi:hypothetical protein